MYRILRIQLTYLKKFNNQKGPSEDTPISSRGGKKIITIMRGRGRLEELAWRAEGEGKVGMVWEQERSPEGQKNIWKYSNS